MLLLSVMVTHAQQFDVKGTIVDKKSNEPIIGASVLIKGTANGTITDIDGKFILKDAKKGNTLVVSYVGYLTQDILLNGNQGTLSIEMEENTELLEEVVVIGYGTQKKQDITGSVVSVGEGKFTEGINTNAFQMINGKAAGVTISQASSARGRHPRFRYAVPVLLTVVTRHWLLWTDYRVWTLRLLIRLISSLSKY